jgi:hypothetical protein
MTLIVVSRIAEMPWHDYVPEEPYVPGMTLVMAGDAERRLRLLALVRATGRASKGPFSDANEAMPRRHWAIDVATYGELHAWLCTIWRGTQGEGLSGAGRPKAVLELAQWWAPRYGYLDGLLIYDDYIS